MTEVSHPHPSVTICNTLWGSNLSFSSYPPTTGGDKKSLSFDQLFPSDETTLVGTCREAGLDAEPLELSKLLLASNSYNTLGVLLKNGVVSVTQPLSSREQMTLSHLACALGLPPAITAITRTLNGASNSSAVWSLRDSEGRIPEDVCFNLELARKLPHRRRKKATSPQPRPLTDDSKETVFKLAKKPENFYALITTLQMHQFNINSDRDKNGDLIIHTAVRGGLPSLPLLLCLLNHFKADINSRDGNGMTPLSLACRLNHVRVAEVLVCVFGADMGLQDPDRGQTALNTAAIYGHPDIIRMLLRRGADGSAEDKNKCNAAFLARKEGHHECRQILTHHTRERTASLAAKAVLGTLDGSKLYPSDVCQVSEQGTTLLILAAQNGHAQLLSQLVRIENCPLDYRQMEIPDLLNESMELSASLKGLPRCNDHPFKTALHYAAQSGHTECVKILLDAHTHPSLPDRDGWLPLHHACDCEHVECVRAIVTHRSTLVLSGLRPAMSLVQERGNNDIITLLQDAMVRRQNEIVNPALFDAAVSGNSDLFFTVLENGDNVNPMKEESCDWPLLLAAGFGYFDIVKQLYQFGGHVTRSHPNTGLTPLHVAARGGRENVVLYLLQFTEPTHWYKDREGEVGREEGGRDINCRTRTGATPLELATVQGHRNIIQILLDAGASCCMPDSDGQLLNCRAFSGVQFFLETYRRERIQAICGALEAAVPLAQFQSIWQGPCDYNLRSESGDTILIVAAEYAPLEVLRFLLLVASRAPPNVLVAGGIPSPSPGRRDGFSAEDSEHTASDTHSHTPNPARKKYNDSWENIPRPASVVPWTLTPRKPQRRNTGESRFFKHRKRPPIKSLTSGTSGKSSNASSEEEGGARRKSPLCCHDDISDDTVVPSNTGICTTILRATNPIDGQTALHRAAVTGRHENLTLLLRADPECATARDAKGNTALHLACKDTQKKSHRKTVEALLACNQIMASVKNTYDKLPEDECPHSKTRQKVIQKRTEEKLDLPPVPSGPPRVDIDPIQSKPLTYSDFIGQLGAIKLKEPKSSASDTTSN